MRKSRIWHSLWLIIPAAVVLPPLGLVMLWKSPRRLLPKMALTLVALALICGAAVAVVKSGYGPWPRPPVPESGFAVEMDERNRYLIPEILPLESEVFNAVVDELRNMRAMASIDMTEISPGEVPQPRMEAYEKVADSFGLSVDDVMAIYRKSSSRLEPKR